MVKNKFLEIFELKYHRNIHALLSIASGKDEKSIKTLYYNTIRKKKELLNEPKSGEMNIVDDKIKIFPK
jgi:hypothetical protein